MWVLLRVRVPPGTQISPYRLGPPGLRVRTPLRCLGSGSDAVGPGRNPSLTKPSPPLSLPNNLHTQKSALGVPAGF